MNMQRWLTAAALALAILPASAANVTFHDLPAATSLADSDEIPAWIAASSATKKITAANLRTTIVNDAELTCFAGLTSAADQAPYFTGPGACALMTVTSAARTLFDDVSTAAMLTTLGAQASSAQLTSAAAVGDGLVAHTAANTFTPRTIAGDGTVITSVTNPGGVAGNPTLVASPQVGSIAGVGDGLVAHTAANTFTPRTITGDGTVVTSITNGNGVSGNPTLVFNGNVTSIAGATDGLQAHTATNTFTPRTITAGTADLSVSNGNGVSGNPTVSTVNPAVVASILTNASTTTSATPSDITGLSFTPVNTTNYAIHCTILYQSSTTTGGLILSLTYGAVTSAFEVRIPDALGLGGEFIGRITATGGTVTAAATPEANVTHVAQIDGWLKTNATTIIQVQKGSEDGTSTISPKAGSHCTFTNLG